MSSGWTRARKNDRSKAADLMIGGCRVRPSLNLIECARKSTRISPRAMDTLVHLASRAGEVVSGDELIDAVWRGRAVYDAQIYKIMSELRRAFRDHGNGESFIQTVPKRGYRLVAPVTPAQPRKATAMTVLGGISWRARVGLAASAVLAVAFLAIVGGFMGQERRLPVEVTPDGSGMATALDGAVQPAAFVGSLAVLPFDVLGSSDEDAYFAAGFHDEILNQLARTTDLQIASRSSVLPYAGQKRAASEIGAELNVGAVLVGSVRYADDRVRIYMQLVNSESDSQIWSASYERDLGDVFAIQTDIALRVATALDGQLDIQARQQHAERLTESPEAYTFYLRAGATAVTPGLPSAARHQYLDQAIALDPAFAEAHARKADVYVVSMVDNFAAGSADRYDLAELDLRARTSAETALALDPGLASSYMALGRLHQYRWRWAEAEQAFERAFVLNPDDLDVLRTYAQFSSHAGDHALAISLAKRATSLAPTQSGLLFREGSAHLYAAEYDLAVAAFHKSIEMNPGHALSRIYLAIVEGILGDAEEALNELNVAEQQLGDEPPVYMATLIAYGLSRFGHPQDAERLIQKVETLTGSDSPGIGSTILLALARGDEDTALDALHQATAAMSSLIPDVSHHNLMLAKANVFADPVLDEQAFRYIRDRINAMLGKASAPERGGSVDKMSDEISARP